MKKNFLKVGFGIFAFFALVGTTYAIPQAHYLLGYSSVDEREIRWNGGTAYRDQLNAAIGTWNALRRVNIAPDTILTYEDLRISDANLPDASWVGRYTYRLVGTDSLELNRAILINKNNNQRQNTITHELGHALGLAHSTLGNVLFDLQTERIVLGAQDLSDYRFLWGN